MGMDSVDRQSLLDADLDPDDPHTWAVHRWISDLLVCYDITRATRRANELRPAEADLGRSGLVRKLLADRKFTLVGRAASTYGQRTPS